MDRRFDRASPRGWKKRFDARYRRRRVPRRLDWAFGSVGRPRRRVGVGAGAVATRRSGASRGNERARARRTRSCDEGGLQAVAAWCDAVGNDGRTRRRRSPHTRRPSRSSRVGSPGAGRSSTARLPRGVEARAEGRDKESSRRRGSVRLRLRGCSAGLSPTMPAQASIRKRAGAALEASPTKAEVASPRVPSLAGRRCPCCGESAWKSALGLGWSSGRSSRASPLPAFAWMVASGTPTGVTANVVEVLDGEPRSLLESSLEPQDPSSALSTPTPRAVLDRAEADRSRLATKDRGAALGLMRTRGFEAHGRRDRRKGRQPL